MPLGLRLALVFLRVFIVFAVFPLLGSVFVVLSSLVAGSLAEDPFPEFVGFGLLALACFSVLLAMIGGASWLESHLKRRPFSFDPGWVVDEIAHPARQMCLPAVGSVALYGYMAVFLWCFSVLRNNPAETFSWPLAWGVIAVGATFLMRYLERVLPR